MATERPPHAQEFARRIKARREELGMTRRDVVESSGLSYPYVSQLETGYRLPSHKSVALLAHALDLEPAELSAAIPYADMTPSPPVLAAMAASDDGTGEDDSGWRGNPAFRPARGRTERPHTTVAGVARQVTELVATLPPQRRLDALHQAQRQVMDDVMALRLQERDEGQEH